VQLDTGEIWASTHTSGVAILDSTLATRSRLNPRTVESGRAGSQGPAKPESSSISAITQSSNGRIWLESTGWLYQFDRDRKQISALALHAGTTHRLGPGQDGVLWVCTQN
jgi:hypothetical protein